jgi:pimeloyl-ACP methyl ester carboxylesterase
MRNERRSFIRNLMALSGGLAAGGGATELLAGQQFLTSARLDGFELFYEVHGEGPAVVFAHGSGGTHMSWWQQVPVFSKRYRCITIDQRAFGYSRDVANGPGRRAFVQDLEGLLTHLKIDRVSLVGQSMGGSTVLPFALKHPERVNALIMAATTGGYSDPEIAALRARVGSTRSAFAPGYAQREPAMAFLYREISALTLDEGAAPALPAGGAGTASAAPTVPTLDLRPIIDRKVPTLFIAGEQDVLIPAQVVEAMHRKVPHSKFVKIAGAGHSAYFETPDEFNRVVMEFLAEHVHN